MTQNKYTTKIYPMQNLMLLIWYHKYWYFLYKIVQAQDVLTQYYARIAPFTGWRELLLIHAFSRPIMSQADMSWNGTNFYLLSFQMVTVFYIWILLNLYDTQMTKECWNIFEHILAVHSLFLGAMVRRKLVTMTNWLWWCAVLYFTIWWTISLSSQDRSENFLYMASSSSRLFLCWRDSLS